MKQKLLVAICAIASMSCASSSQRPSGSDNGIEKQLANVERSWGDSYARRDIAILDRLLTDEFVDISEDGFMDKAAYLAQTKGLGATSDSFVFSEHRVRRYGDVAVSTGRLRWESDPERMAAPYMAVYVMRDGHWRPVAFQLTPTPRSEGPVRGGVSLVR
jgi:ketosteroid isomerase-like protein